MDNKSVRCRIDLAIRSAIAEGTANDDAKEKIDAIVNMAVASAKSIVESVNISFDVLLTLLGNRLISKAAETYMSNIERREKNVEAETLSRKEAE